MKIGIGLGIGYGTFKKSGPTAAQISADFTARVIANGGSLTITQQNAILALVTNLVNNGLWNKMKIIYPFVGGTAASCAVNLVNSSYTATFSSGWTFTATGATPTGANTFMLANGFNTSLLLSNFDTCFSYYSRTNNTFNGFDFGCQNFISDTSRIAASIYYGGLSYYNSNNTTTGQLSVTNSNTSGLYIMSRETNAIQKSYRNSLQVGQNLNTMTTPLPNCLYSIGTLNFNDGTNYVSTNRQCAFSHVSSSLTASEALNFYNNVQTFQTSLSRQV